MAPKGLRSSFAQASGLDVFFTGGAISVNPSGESVACASGEECAVIHLDERTKRQTLKGDTEPVTAVCFVTGTIVAVASRSLQVRLYSLTHHGSIEWSIKPHRLPVSSLAATNDGALLATASADATAKVWDIRQGHCSHVLKGHSALLLCADFHPDPSIALLATSADDGEVRVWDLPSRASIFSSRDHFSSVPCVRFSFDGTALASAGRDKVAHVWSFHGKKRMTLQKESAVPFDESLESVAFVHADCRLPGAQQGSPHALVAVGERGRVKVISSGTGQKLAEQGEDEGASPRDGFVFCHVGPQGLLVATGDCRLLVMRQADEEVSSRMIVVKELVGNLDEALDLNFLPRVQIEEGDTEMDDGDPLQSNRLVVATSSDTLRVFECYGLSCTGSLQGHSDTVLALDTAAPKRWNRRLAISGSKDALVKLWDLDNCSQLATGEGHLEAVSAVCLAKRDGITAVSGGADCMLTVWNVEAVMKGRSGSRLTMTATIEAHDKDINHLSIAPNDSLVATASGDKTAKVFALPTLDKLVTLRGHKRSVWTASFSPVDKCIATGSADKTIRLWNLDGECLRTFEGHSSSVLKLCFATAGTQLVSAGGDGVVKAWSVRHGECMCTLEGHDDKIWAVATAQDGDFLASAGADATVKVWRDVTQQEAEEEAKREAERAEKEQELENAMAHREYRRAVGFALELGRPNSLMNVFTRLLAQEGDQTVGDVLEGIDSGALSSLLDYAKEWNASSRSSEVAQRVLACLFTRFSASQIASIPGAKSAVDAILPYSRRHFARVERLLQSTYLLDCTLAAMGALEDGALTNGLDESG